MKVGLLWFDDNPGSDLETKVRRAVAHYERKHGASPDTCYVHPSLLGDNRKVKQVGTVVVRPRRATSPNHFWLGREENRERPG